MEILSIEVAAIIDKERAYSPVPRTFLYTWASLTPADCPIVTVVLSLTRFSHGPDVALIEECAPPTRILLAREHRLLVLASGVRAIEDPLYVAPCVPQSDSFGRQKRKLSAKMMTWKKTALATVMALVIFLLCFYVTTIILSVYSPLDAAIISF